MRLDQLLVTRGLFPSREKARRAIMAGEIEVAGRRVDKAGTNVAEDAKLHVKEREPFVSATASSTTVCARMTASW